jgi:putative RNA 2'-phosphotransferase
MLNSKSIIKRSKHLSLILRHDPSSVGLTLDENGWVFVKDLLHAIGWKMSEL